MYANFVFTVITRTELKVFVDKTVRGRARTERGNARGGAPKKREISRSLLSINLHFSVYPIPDTWNAFFRLEFHITEKLTNDFSVILNFRLKSAFHVSGIGCIRNSAKFRCNQSWILACYKLPYIIKSVAT